MGTSSIEAIDTMLATRQELLVILQRKLLKVQQTMKVIADKKRRFLEFKVGDFVYLKLRPYRQRSLAPTTYHKLSKRFYGPYKVLERIGPVAYRLELPLSSKIHPVFHCSLLKLHHGPLEVSAVDLPPSVVDHNPLVEPLAIVDTKWDTTTDPPTRLVLVQWLGLAPEDTSWEKWTELQLLYHLEDKVSFPDTGIVSTNNMGLTKRIRHQPIWMRDYVPR
jgi:hypothetical protein